MASFCTICGTMLSPGAAFCPSCGKPTGAGGQASPPPTPQQAYAAPPGYPPPRSTGVNSSTIMWGIIGLVIVLLAIAVGYLIVDRNSDASDSDSTVEESVDGRQAGDAIGPEVIKVVNSTANIRNIATAQGPDSRIMGQLQRGTQVRGTMHRGLSGTTSWFKLADGRGYVSSVNLADGLSPEMPVARAPIANANYCVVATYQGNLRIRNSPGGRIIGALPRGSRFQAYDTQYDIYGSTWVHVQPVDTRYPVGWVSGNHIAC